MVYPSILYMLNFHIEKYKVMIKKERLRTLFIFMMYLYSYILEEGRIEKILYEKDL